MKIKSTIISLILVLLLTACVKDPAAQAIKPTSQETPGHTTTTTEQATITPLSTATSTSTLEPTIESTPTIRISLTPTIEKTQFSIQKDFLMEVIESNGSCDFPCIWGITPGETSYFDVEEMLISLKSGSHGNFEIYNNFRENALYVPVGLEYFPNSSDNHIQEAARMIFDYTEDEKMIAFVTFGYSQCIYDINSEMGSEKISDLPINRLISIYRLSNVLQNYGKPDEVYIGIISRVEPEGNRYDEFNLILYYRELSFSVQFEGELKISGQYLFVCLNNANIGINSWDENYLPMDYPSYEFMLITKPNTNFFDYKRHTFEETFSMSIDDFVRLYSNPEYQECLSTTADMWE